QSFYLHTLGLSLTYLGFGMILLVCLYWPSGGGRYLRWPVTVLARVGFYSYSIYLWHFFAKWWALMLARSTFAGGKPLPYLAELGIYILASIVVGIALAWMIELPFLRWRDRLFPSRSAAIEQGCDPGLSDSKSRALPIPIPPWPAPDP